MKQRVLIMVIALIVIMLSACQNEEGNLTYEQDEVNVQEETREETISEEESPDTTEVAEKIKDEYQYEETMAYVFSTDEGYLYLDEDYEVIYEPGQRDDAMDIQLTVLDEEGNGSQRIPSVLVGENRLAVMDEAIIQEQLEYYNYIHFRRSTEPEEGYILNDGFVIVSSHEPLKGLYSLLPVGQDDKVGLMSADGKTMIHEEQYTDLKGVNSNEVVLASMSGEDELTYWLLYPDGKRKELPGKGNRYSVYNGQESIIVKNESSYGLMNEQGEQILETIYDRIMWNEDGDSYIVHLDDRIGLVNNDGTFIVPLETENYTLLNHDDVLFKAEDGTDITAKIYMLPESHGYISRYDVEVFEHVSTKLVGLVYNRDEDNEQVLLEPVYAGLNNVSFGAVDWIVETIEGQLGIYLAQEGRWLIEPEFEEIEVLYEGDIFFYGALKDGVWRIISSKGEVILPKELILMSSFGDRSGEEGMFYFVRNRVTEHEGVIKLNGEFALAPEYKGLDYLLNLGQDPSNLIEMLSEDNLYGLWSTTYGTIIPQDYYRIDWYEGYETLFAVSEKGTDIYDTQGNILLTLPYQLRGIDADDNDYIVQLGDVYGVADKDGTYLLEPEYQYLRKVDWTKVLNGSYTALPAKNNLYIAENMDGKWGLIEEDGRIVSEFIYDGIEQVQDSSLTYRSYFIVHTQDGYGLMDIGGEILLDTSYQYIEAMAYNDLGYNLLWITGEEDNVGLYDMTQGRFLQMSMDDRILNLPEYPDYDDQLYLKGALSENVLFVRDQDNNDRLMLRHESIELIPYRNIEFLHTGNIIMQTRDAYYMISPEGEEIFGPVERLYQLDQYYNGEAYEPIMNERFGTLIIAENNGNKDLYDSTGRKLNQNDTQKMRLEDYYSGIRQVLY